MGLYRTYVLPHLINFAMSSKDVAVRRAALIPKATGSVLEIGIGSGLNLPYYSSAVTHLRGVDASAELLAMTRRKVERVTFPVELVHESAEHLSADRGSVDTVVATWTLCSISDPLAALREMKRVLKPEGQLLFVEHGLSSDPAVQAWQRRLEPAWKRLAGGCHLSRKIDELIRSAGLDLAQLQTSYLPGPRPMTYTYEGAARH
jgi:ubiquinone/menaquinone biosynthesis C-methylase UbiE